MEVVNHNHRHQRNQVFHVAAVIVAQRERFNRNLFNAHPQFLVAVVDVLPRLHTYFSIGEYFREWSCESVKRVIRQCDRGDIHSCADEGGKRGDNKLFRIIPQKNGRLRKEKK